MHADLTDPHATRAGLNGIAFDAVIHFASLARARQTRLAYYPQSRRSVPRYLGVAVSKPAGEPRLSYSNLAGSAGGSIHR